VTAGVLREQPTAVLTARDLSASDTRASAAREARGLTEDELIAGGVGRVAPVKRVEVCMCGGVIVAYANVTEAVSRHNRSNAHRHWIVEAGWR
jgi:hypothetical protein